MALGVLREQVQALVSDGLLDSADILASFLVSASNACQDLPVPARAENLILYADIALQKRDFKRAMDVFRQAQQLHRLARASPVGQPALRKAQASGFGPSPAEIALKLKIAQCYCGLGDLQSAYSELDYIPPRARTLKVNVEIARLAHSLGHVRTAVAAYKEVLRTYPNAVEAMLGLAQLHVPYKDIMSRVLPGGAGNRKEPNGSEQPLAPAQWVPRLVEAHCAAAAFEHSGALANVRQLEQLFPKNPHLLLTTARVETRQGNRQEALLAYRAARQAEASNLQGADEYALLVAHSRATLGELSALAAGLLHGDVARCEPWTVSALFWHVRHHDRQRALAYVDKGIQVAPRHATSYLIKGHLALTNKKPDVALAAFRKAHSLEPDLRSLEGLVRASLTGGGRQRDALAYAREALKMLPHCAPALALAGDAFASVPDGMEKAGQLYESALRIDADCLPAVLGLTELQRLGGRFPEAIQLLTQHLARHVSDELHAQLATVLTSAEELREAMSHFNAALSINPQNEYARKGLERVEKLMKGEDPDAVDSEEQEVDDGHEHGHDDQLAGWG